jgi:hypothetical protein
MAAEKEAGPTRRKGSAGRGGGGRTVAKAGHDATAVADVDPWGSFFEKFWEQAAEGEGTDRHDGGREPAKSPRKTGPKAGR